MSEIVDVSEEFEPEPEPVKKRTSSKKRVKKTVTIYAEDNIIPNPDVALELGKSISLTEAEEAEASRKVHATHARIITESVPTPARRRSSETSHKLKGFQYLTLEEQEVVDTMKALKESRKSSRRQPSTGGSNEGTGRKPGVPDESTVVSAASSKGTGIKPGVPDKDKDITEEKVILEWGDT
ncbi:hypothetical protein Tco_1075451 [Tanacetum coccineum]